MDDEAKPISIRFSGNVSPEDRWRLLELLDTLYRSVGGDGLKIVRSQVYRDGEWQEVMDDRELSIVPDSDDGEDPE